MNARYTFPIYVALIILICGCSTMTPIHTYTTASQQGVEAYVSLKYNFEQNCLSSCRDRDLEAFRLTSVDCDCIDSKHADSINTMMVSAIKAYICALGQMSGKDVTALPIQTLSESIQASPTFKLNLSQKEIDAYTTIADLLSNTITSRYRKNELKSFVSKAQTPLTTIITYLQLNLSRNLIGIIDIRIQRNKSIFYEYIRDRRYTPYQKREITTGFYKIYDFLEVQKKRYQYFTQVLEEIKNGHKDLYSNLETIDSGQLTTMMTNNAVAIDTLINEIEELN